MKTEDGRLDASDAEEVTRSPRSVGGQGGDKDDIPPPQTQTISKGVQDVANQEQPPTLSPSPGPQ